MEVITHPLLQSMLSHLRQRETTGKRYRELVTGVTSILFYEALRDIQLTEKTINTPLEEFVGPTLLEKPPVITPILRAGLGMIDGCLAFFPDAKIGHIGIYRDEKTKQPQPYYFKIPTNCEDRLFVLCDPILATGGTAVAAIDELKSAGITKIKFICIVSAPEGVDALTKAHPEIPAYTASIDRQLNDDAYILPGLGDAGDRLFGTIGM